MIEERTAEIELAPERVKALLAGGEADLVDVRRDYEWEAGRIRGARRIEMNDLRANADSIARDQPIVFYCRTGNRSEMAAAAFRDAGYDAYNLAGGIQAWADAGLPLDPDGGEVAPPRAE